MDKIIAACGNNCAVCPRYTAPPYEKMTTNYDKPLNYGRKSDTEIPLYPIRKYPV